MTEPANILAPDSDVMAQFLEHAFGGYLDGLHGGLVEIACSINQGDKPNERWWSRLFGTDELDDAVAYAAEQNSKHGINLYFAPALRDKSSPRNERGNKAKVIGTLMLWCEWDDEKSFNSAKEKFTFAKPTAGELTGVIPEKRAQAFWRLKTAIVGNDEIDAAVNGLCVALGGDPKVVHADCLMRLPGSISWRKLDKPERQDEMTWLEIGSTDRPPAYAVEQILQAYPPRARDGAGPGYSAPVNLTRNSSLGLGGAVTDGRESYMRNTVLACLIEFVGTNGAAPTVDELFEMAWPQYSANVDFSRPGRGSDEFRLKCVSTVKRFTTGRISGLWSLEDAVAAYAKKKPAVEIPGSEAVNFQTGETIDNIRFKLIPYGQIIPNLEARYLVKGLISAQSLIIAWGPPKCGKSFWFSDVAMHIAAGMSYRGLRVEGGLVVYIAAEGAFGFMGRVDAWRAKRAADRGEIPFHLLPMRLDLVVDHPRFIADIKAQIGDQKPVLVVIDTLNRTFTGSESSDEDMTAYVKAADAIKEAFSCSAAVIHHCGIEGTRPRGHTSLTGAADTQIAISKDASGLVSAKLEYMKDGPEGYENQSRLEIVEIGFDKDGDAVTTCVIEPTNETATAPTKRLSPGPYLALETLKQAISDEGKVSGQNHIPSSARTVSVDLWRRYFYLRSTEEAPDGNQATRKKAFQRAAIALQSKGVVGAWNDLVWVVEQ